MSNTPLSIEEVEQSFSVWRKNKTGNPPIPDDLWDQVSLLLKTHRRSKVFKRLRLTIQQARDKGILPIESSTNVPDKNTFIQIPMPQPTMQVIAPPKANTLTIQRGDKQLCLSHPSDEQIHFIITTLLR
jgi:hypothetical protein